MCLQIQILMKVFASHGFATDVQYPNQTPKNRDLQLLKEIQKHIATAEVSNWVGLVSFNTVDNLYPCLHEQYNKQRLYQPIAAME